MTHRLTIVVTGIGAIIGQGIISSLRAIESGVKIVGVDRNPRSSSRQIVDDFESKPECDEANQSYLDFWVELVSRHQVSLIFPGVDADIRFFNMHRELFHTLGVSVALNSPKLLQATTNKWLFHQDISQLDIEVIPSCRPNSWTTAIYTLGSPPFIFKPLEGSGSQGIHLIEDELDFNYFSAKCDAEWMLQKYVGCDEQEYTVGIFGFGNGHYIGPLRLLRRLASAGCTQQAEVVGEIPVMDDVIRKLCVYYQPEGPTNFQFRMSDGKAYLLEINPRFSSSNSLRTAFGFNEADMSVKYYCNGIRPDMPKIRKGIGWRYFADRVEYDSNIN